MVPATAQPQCTITKVEFLHFEGGCSAPNSWRLGCELATYAIRFKAGKRATTRYYCEFHFQQWAASKRAAIPYLDALDKMQVIK